MIEHPVPPTYINDNLNRLAASNNELCVHSSLLEHTDVMATLLEHIDLTNQVDIEALYDICGPPQ